MEFSNISSFLEKFINLSVSQEKAKKEIHSSILKEAGISIDNKDISIDKEIVYISGSPYVKSVIFMNKEKILNNLKKVLTNKSPKDIL